MCLRCTRGASAHFLKKNVFCIFVFLLWFLLLKQTSIAIFAMTLPCSAVFYRYENVVKCKACVSSIRERADKNQQRSTNHDSLFAYLLFIGFLFVQGVFFIGPESDHWQCLSVTHSLTNSLTNSLLFSKLD